MRQGRRWQGHANVERFGSRLTGWLLLALVLATSPLKSQETPRFGARFVDEDATRLSSRHVPTPIEDDAGLHDVQFVGSQQGWVVGEEGVIWHTSDGGQSWSLQKSPVRAALRSISFLTDRVGWIVGGMSVPYARLSTGIVLSTKDGGETWQQLALEALPELHRVRFFGLENGIVVGESSEEYPAGVMMTHDGGKSWLPIPGERAASWRAAAFPRPDLGVVAGTRGQVGLVGGGRLLLPRNAELGLRGLNSVDLNADGKGWLVGDGGLTLRTDNGGLVWRSPDQPLPQEVSDIFDFKDVCFRGDRGWIVGQPGTVIWHTADGGKTWSPQLTRQNLPLDAVSFDARGETGWAVGALGVMLQTIDGGETWLPVRGGGRRAAWFALHARKEQVSLPLVARLSGEGGYRGVVSVWPRTDLGPDGHASAGSDLRLNEAVVKAGGASGKHSWQFPIALTGLEDDYNKLVADWNRRTEGRLADKLIGQLVCELRTWRPSVVVLDEPEPGDAVTKLMHEAALRAIEQAADSTRFFEHSEVAALQPWQVQKVYVRLKVGSTAETVLDPHEFLPRTGSSLAVASAEPHAILFPQVKVAQVHVAYRQIVNRLPDGATGASSDMFAGLAIAPGSDARRAMPLVAWEDMLARQKLAQRQRNFENTMGRFVGDDRQAASWLAQLDDIAGNMPDDQAALQLAKLAEGYRQAGRWQLAETTLIELVDRYPHEPPARDAMRWLLQLWTSVEVGWRRTRDVGVTREYASTDIKLVADRLRNISRNETENSDAYPEEDGIQQTSGQLPIRRQKEAGILLGDRVEATAQLAKDWQDRARDMAKRIEQTTPALARLPEIQMPLASLARQRRRYADSDEIMRNLLRGGGESPWKKTATAELWLARPVGETPDKGLHICRATETRPQLDGLLSDACWQFADEMMLRESAEGEPEVNHPFVLMSYDQEYFYIAGSFPRMPGAAPDLPDPKGRQHDADLSPFDRIALHLDIDRDYTTSYQFQVDQRGWTAEDCWGDTTWNPKWYVAAAGDAASWRFEAAIPWEELVPERPQRNSIWSASVVRTVPAITVQGWTQPATSVPRLETGGLIRFE